MESLLYIHGFLSSPLSLKARQMGEWLQENRPQIEYLCPLLTPYPDQTRASLEQLIQSCRSDRIYLMGSSLGGFWATWLAEKYNLRAVLFNPVVDLGLFSDTYINVRLKNYHSDDTYLLNQDHVAAFRQVNVPVIRHIDNYFVMVQSGDEVLDYKLAVNKYAGCKQLVIDGGDHTFQDFQKYIPVAMQFLEA